MSDAGRRPSRRQAWLAEQLGPRPVAARLAAHSSSSRAGRRRRGRPSGTAAGLPGWADPIVHEEFAAAGAVGAGRRRRHGPRRPDAARPRLRRPQAPAAAAGDHRRGHVVPAVQRADQRLRPRRPGDARRARRRRVGRQRPEAVEHERPPRRPRPAARPHRPRRPQAPRHQLLRAADAPARRRGPPGAPDERALVVQRGVPDRRPRAGRRTSSAARATAGASP